MAVPTFDEFFLPFLRMVAEHGQVSLAQAKALLAERMGVSEEDQRELLPSGRQGRYDNRVGWARTYLAKAGLIRTVARGVFELTDAGRQLLATDPPEVTVATLQTYEPFREWQKLSRTTSDSVPPISVPPPERGGTPVEVMNEAYELLRSSLATELAESLQRVSWSHFEQIVIDVLLALGYGGSRSGAGHAFRKSGDGGVDGVINEDRLGLSKIYVQAKRYAPENKQGVAPRRSSFRRKPPRAEGPARRVHHHK